MPMRVCLWILLFVPFLVWGQGQAKIDSLQSLLKEASQDSVRYKHFVSLGIAFEKESKIDSAVASYRNARALVPWETEPKKNANALLSMGNAYLSVQDFQNAFKNYSLADSLCQTHTDLKVSTVRARALNFLGYAVRLTHDYDKAMEYYNASRDLYEQLGKPDSMHEVNIALAQAYTNKNDYDRAVPLLDNAIKYFEQYPERNPYSYAIICRGYLFLRMRDFDRAEKDYLKYYELSNKSQKKIQQLWAMSYLGSFYRQKKDYPTAISWYEKGVAKADTFQNFSYKERMQKGLLGIYKRLNDSEKLSATYEDYIRTRDVLDSLATNKEIYALEAKYQTEKKEQQIALLASQNEVVAQQKANQRNLFLGGLIATSLLGVFFFVLYRNRQKTNNKLRELDAFKTNLFTHISHELRTPLTLILGPVEKQLQDKNTPSNIKEELSLVQHNSDRLLRMVDQMSELANVNSGQLKLKVKSGDLKLLLEQELAAFKYRASEKNITLTHEFDNVDNAWFDSDVVQKITANLLSNSIKYAPEGSDIKVIGKIQNQALHLSVNNEAEAIKEANLDQWFERFYQRDTASKGMGVGLALVKELAGLHKGEVRSQKTSESRVEFVVTLPIDKEVFSAEERMEATAVPLNTVSTIEKNVSLSEDASVLLIVEDDDAIRTFVRSIFQDTYTVAEAINGEEGIKKAVTLVPDLIISDVMMPKVDGFELTKAVKEDQRTSHIPIILLTAKVTDADKVTGISSGADDYIVKPFKSDLLKAKVEKLIELRMQLQKRYSQEIVLRPTDITIPSTEEQFLKSLQSILDEKLIESNFTVEELSATLGMSRMQLHRKLKALTGLSASEFLRSERLKMAANLLSNSDTIVSQVGYAVGFNDPSYFTKCFKKQFGHTPSEYAKKA